MYRTCTERKNKVCSKETRKGGSIQMNARDVRKIASCALYVGVLLILFVFF